MRTTYKEILRLKDSETTLLEGLLISRKTFTYEGIWRKLLLLQGCIYPWGADHQGEDWPLHSLIKFLQLKIRLLAKIEGPNLGTYHQIW